jgi:hypothetical protein
VGWKHKKRWYHGCERAWRAGCKRERKKTIRRKVLNLRPVRGFKGASAAPRFNTGPAVSAGHSPTHACVSTK